MNALLRRGALSVLLSLLIVLVGRKRCQGFTTTTTTGVPVWNTHGNGRSLVEPAGSRLKLQSERSKLWPPSHLILSLSESSNSEESPSENTSQTGGQTKKEDNAESLELLIKKRQRQVQIGYQATGMIYTIVAMLHLARKGFNFWSLYYILGGGPAVLAGMAFLLKGATAADSSKEAAWINENRKDVVSLQSNTYKRMNWMLMGHAVLSLTMPVIDPAHFLIPFFVVPSLSALWNAGKGYMYGGVIGWNPTRHICAVFTDIQQGWSQSTKPILRRFQWKSSDYMLLGGMLGLMTLVKLQEVMGWISAGIAGSSSYAPVALASRISRLARLMVLSGVAFTLKDAADQDLLSHTPFWQLNALMSVAMASLTGYLWSPGSLRIISTSFALGAASLLFAGVTGFHALQAARSSNSNANGSEQL